VSEILVARVGHPRRSCRRSPSLVSEIPVGCTGTVLPAERPRGTETRSLAREMTAAPDADQLVALVEGFRARTPVHLGLPGGAGSSSPPSCTTAPPPASPTCRPGSTSATGAAATVPVVRRRQSPMVPRQLPPARGRRGACLGPEPSMGAGGCRAGLLRPAALRPRLRRCDRDDTGGPRPRRPTTGGAGEHRSPAVPPPAPSARSASTAPGAASGQPGTRPARGPARSPWLGNPVRQPGPATPSASSAERGCVGVRRPAGRGSGG
jgi:hypothetical protein